MPIIDMAHSKEEAERLGLNVRSVDTYTYTIRTDGVMQDVDATDADEAARLFAEDEFLEASIRDVADLFAPKMELSGIKKLLGLVERY